MRDRYRKSQHWRYALSAIVLAILALAGVRLFVVKSAGRFVKDWHYIAEAYVNSQASRTGLPAEIVQVARARYPFYFTSKLALQTFGDGTYFTVDQVLGAETIDTKIATSTLSEVGIVKRSLPYPPRLLLCLYLVYPDKAEAVIFLGYHTDMYMAEWVAHHGQQAPFSSAFLDVVSKLGCDMSLPSG